MTYYIEYLIVILIFISCSPVSVPKEEGMQAVSDLFSGSVDFESGVKFESGKGKTKYVNLAIRNPEWHPTQFGHIDLNLLAPLASLEFNNTLEESDFPDLYEITFGFDSVSYSKKVFKEEIQLISEKMDLLNKIENDLKRNRINVIFDKIHPDRLVALDLDVKKEKLMNELSTLGNIKKMFVQGIEIIALAPSSLMGVSYYLKVVGENKNTIIKIVVPSEGDSIWDIHPIG